jgi:hypothetical protein
VAVIDTGVLQHADLAGRVLPGYDFVSDPARANDGGGRDADASDPGDWIATADRTLPIFSDCDVAPSSWHGSSIAGIIASNADNAQWTAGINWAAKILPVRVLGKCDGTDSDILDGVAWAAGLAVPGVPANPNPAQVINLSLGGPGPCDPAYRSVFGAALAHGITRAIIAGRAAGEDGESCLSQLPEAIAVASTTSVSSLARYSNWNGVALSAPGGQPGPGSTLDSIIALSNAGATVPQSDSFDYLGGTSSRTDGAESRRDASWRPASLPRRSLDARRDGQTLRRDVDVFSGPLQHRHRCHAAVADKHGAANCKGLWWAAREVESDGTAWRIRGDLVTWFTYDATGKGVVLTMSAAQTTTGTTPVRSQTTGPDFDAVPFDPARVTRSAVRTGTLPSAILPAAYRLHGRRQQAKAITRVRAHAGVLFGGNPSWRWRAAIRTVVGGTGELRVGWGFGAPADVICDVHLRFGRRHQAIGDTTDGARRVRGTFFRRGPAFDRSRSIGAGGACGGNADADLCRRQPRSFDYP